MNTKKSRPLIIAHRTNAGGCPENSLSGIRAALALGVDMIELDLQRTTDGRLVLMHDSRIDRTTNGSGKLKSFSYEQLLEFQLNSTSEVRERIPLFEEVLQLVQDSEVRLVLEMKSPKQFPGVGAEVVRLLEQFKMRERVALISFDSGFLREFKREYPDIFVASLSLFPLGPKASDNFDGVGILYPGLLMLKDHKRLWKLLRLDDMKVFAWTANSAKAIRKLSGMKIEGIITDKPELLWKILSEKGLAGF